MIICSIIIPLFNSEENLEYLFVAIKPYINNEKYEIIFVDDFSRDNTKNLLEEYIANKSPLNLVFLKNNRNFGPAYSRNLGIKSANGKYIAFLDSDDAWHSNKLELQLEYMSKNSISFCGTKHKILSNKEDLINYNSKQELRSYKISFLGALFKPPFATPSVIIEKKLVMDYMFNDKIRYGEDYDLWLRVLRNNKAFKIINNLTFTFKHDFLNSKSSLSTNLTNMHLSNLEIFKSIYSFEKNIYIKFMIILAYLYEIIKYNRRILIKFFLKYHK
tara:strand:+ start:769 stop:1590 length:822 start_codon:yes stop_codon:yes gene_type:complete